MFTFKNVTYTCGEQFIMCTKAKLFGDLESIHASNHESKKCKASDLKHDNQVHEMILLGIQAKFEQNNTGEQRTAEANPYDKIFGISITINHPDAWVLPKWPTKDKFVGNILEDMRRNVVM